MNNLPLGTVTTSLLHFEQHSAPSQMAFWSPTSLSTFSEEGKVTGTFIADWSVTHNSPIGGEQTCPVARDALSREIFLYKAVVMVTVTVTDYLF